MATTPVFLPGKFHGQRSPAVQSMGSQRVRHDWAHTHTHTHTQLPGDFMGGRGTNTSLIYTHICFILFFPLQLSLFPYFINNLFSMLFYVAIMNVLSWWWLTSSYYVNFKCYSLRIQPSLLQETILSTLSKF